MRKASFKSCISSMVIFIVEMINLKALTQIKTKNELIGEVIGLLQSPAKRVLAALLHHHESKLKQLLSNTLPMGINVLIPNATEVKMWQYL
jgi:hypothetical protein